MEKIPITTYSAEEMAKLMQAWGEPSFRAQQVWEWIHKKHAFSFSEMTNLSKPLRQRLDETFLLDCPTERAACTSSDGTTKFLLSYPDGVAVECVSMPSTKRLAACLSTQDGCAMSCAFCATGKAGFSRNLSAEEIVAQARHIERFEGRRISSVVLMGQGEPFLNFENTLSAMRNLNDESSFGIGARHITVSTAGIVSGITQLSKIPEQFGLAVSLHSAIQETRDSLMPGVKKYSLVHLYDALRVYTQETGRRPTYEYLMIKGINDTDAHLRSLRDFCNGTLCHVNLIELNRVPGSSFAPSSALRIRQFQTHLKAAGIETTIRRSRGQDIDAACGQLAQKF